MTKLFRPKKYFRPNTIDEMISLLKRYGEKASIIAGGTDLLVDKPHEKEYLIDIKSLPLNYVTSDDAEGIRIGASTTFKEIENSALLRRGAYRILVDAARNIGHPNLRNLATIGGNICKAVPSADSPPALIVLDASAKIISASGERTMLLENFFTDAKKTVLNKDEMLMEIQVPRPRPRTGAAFSKVGRTHVDIALVNVAIGLTLDKNEVCRDVKIVLGAVAPTPIRATKSEELLKGKSIDKILIEKVSQLSSEEIKPISDVRSSADYRRELSKVLVKRSLEEALERARKGD